MFAVIWANAALDELADVYVAATAEERIRIAAGVDALNTRLASDPLNEGEARTGKYRIAFPDLLAVVFRVSEADHTVRIAAVARYGN
jgi:hypothetical protein